MIFLYDGSFQGLLTIIYLSLKNEVTPSEVVIKDKYQQDLFAETITVATDKDKSEKILRHIKENLGLAVLKNVYYGFLSNTINIEMEILQYLKLCFQHKTNIEGFYSNESVNNLIKSVDRVTAERHKFYGMLRFKKLANGIYYAPFEPDNNITVLLMTHFQKRLSDQKWVIHDVKRNVGAFYDGVKTILVRLDDYYKTLLNDKDNHYLHPEEKIYSKLWKTFFKTIAIAERINPKLQRQFIPLRYWKHLTEKN